MRKFSWRQQYEFPERLWRTVSWIFILWFSTILKVMKTVAFTSLSDWIVGLILLLAGKGFLTSDNLRYIRFCHNSNKKVPAFISSAFIVMLISSGIDSSDILIIYLTVLKHVIDVVDMQHSGYKSVSPRGRHSSPSFSYLPSSPSIPCFPPPPSPSLSFCVPPPSPSLSYFSSRPSNRPRTLIEIPRQDSEPQESRYLNWEILFWLRINIQYVKKSRQVADTFSLSY